MANLIITRSGEFTNIATPYKIIVDHTATGYITNGDNEEIVLGAGPHTLRCTTDWRSSDVLSFTIEEDETKYFFISASPAARANVPIIAILALLNIGVIFFSEISTLQSFIISLVTFVIVLIITLKNARLVLIETEKQP